MNSSTAVTGAGGVTALAATGSPSIWAFVGLAVALCTIGYLLLAAKNVIPARRRATTR
ncbi:hypothetical protein [Phytoactinopolyspora halotolerans]|uniref:Uncharacterized protein n=1 Tax=Phytoactinopolyspora halotolerans TaxID=1981512 RepID=A0A6L9SFB6_9ACTN|nr:hypothetical protein [Phytoactinopolyspora halotolerans]NEE03298.1 hypothetical protein [Phytoactinopolyspora halotolerans]